MIVKVNRFPFWSLLRNLIKRTVILSTISFGDYASVIGPSISSLGVLNNRFLVVPTVSKISVTLVDWSISFLSTLVVGIIRSVLDYVTVKNSHYLLHVAKIKRIQWCLSVPIIHRDYIPLRRKFCVKIGYSYFTEAKITIPTSNLPSTLICDDKIIMDDSYFILIAFQYFFIFYLVSHKFLRSIGCPLNYLSVTSLHLKLNSSDTTLQLKGIVPLSLSSSLSTMYFSNNRHLSTFLYRPLYLL